MALILYALVKSTVEDGLNDNEVIKIFKDSSPEVIQLFIRAARQDIPVEKEPFLAWLKEDEKLYPDEK
jgi:hypothetical protein